MTNVKNLYYLRACIDESLRVRPALRTDFLVCNRSRVFRSDEV